MPQANPRRRTAVAVSILPGIVAATAGNPIFQDGFESADLSAWSQSQP